MEGCWFLFMGYSGFTAPTKKTEDGATSTIAAEATANAEKKNEDSNSSDGEHEGTSISAGTMQAGT